MAGEPNEPTGLVRVEASSLQEAMTRISERFGPEVSIVHTRVVRRKGVLGALGVTGVEVYVTGRSDYEAWRDGGRVDSPKPTVRSQQLLQVLDAVREKGLREKGGLRDTTQGAPQLEQLLDQVRDELQRVANPAAVASETSAVANADSIHSRAISRRSTPNSAMISSSPALDSQDSLALESQGINEHATDGQGGSADPALASSDENARPGYDRPGYDRPGYDKPGYERFGPPRPRSDSAPSTHADSTLSSWRADPSAAMPADGLSSEGTSAEELRSDGLAFATRASAGSESADIRHAGRSLPLRKIDEGARAILASAQRILEEADCSLDTMRELLDRMRRRTFPGTSGDAREIRSLARIHLGELIRPKLPPCIPIRAESAGQGPRVVAVAGPTGVGKTTTIAKLASPLHLVQRKKVGLITLDTYRIGAIDQLRRFAEILSLPLEVVDPGDSVRAAVNRLRHCDVIFLDTAGRSQKDACRLAEMPALFDGMGLGGDGLGNRRSSGAGLEIHLCISMTSSRRTNLEVLEKFKVLPYDRLLITKLDESGGQGALLDLFRAARTPVSYVTCGQEVPDDIRAASVDLLERLILGE